MRAQFAASRILDWINTFLALSTNITDGVAFTVNLPTTTVSQNGNVIDTIAPATLRLLYKWQSVVLLDGSARPPVAALAGGSRAGTDSDSIFDIITTQAIMQVSTERELSLVEPPDASTASHRTASRDANLDLMRFAAIVLVIAFHTGAIHPSGIDLVDRACRLGEFGVDVFFLLSGWLIGGLYWRELRRAGHVSVRHFWARRMMRTLPPYYAALLLAWGSVYLARHQPFDWRYLLFLQNYREAIPYFVVSWSLCVEEHFYLLLPILLLVFRNRWALLILAVVAAVAPPVFRLVSHPLAETGAFPIYQTHCRSDGLTIGVICAYVATYHPAVLARMVRPARLIFWLLLMVFLSSAFWPEPAIFRAAYTTATWVSAAALIAGAGAASASVGGYAGGSRYRAQFIQHLSYTHLGSSGVCKGNHEIS